MKNFDNSFLSESIKLIAGTDEAGRGPLAGPVVAAAVIFSPETYFEGVNDSKRLSESKREELFPIITQQALAYSVSVISNSRIDRINILRASLLAMKKAVNTLTVKPDLVLIDGNKSFSYEPASLAVVKGDTKSFAIAAASIVAKVTRDRIMKRLSNKYPQYLWAKNKGYPTREHIQAVKLFGPTEFHRKTFLQNILTNEFKAEHLGENKIS